VSILVNGFLFPLKGKHLIARGTRQLQGRMNQNVLQVSDAERNVGWMIDASLKEDRPNPVPKSELTVTSLLTCNGVMNPGLISVGFTIGALADGLGKMFSNQIQTYAVRSHHWG
jgi:hypothetical protein